jgi:hypothetical protein
MDSDTSTTTSDVVAGTIRSAAAWWQLAADALDRGDLAQAQQCARLGAFGTADVVARIDELRTKAADGR